MGQTCAHLRFDQQKIQLDFWSKDQQCVPGIAAFVYKDFEPQFCSYSLDVFELLRK
jgi:hypothetical protein